MQEAQQMAALTRPDQMGGRGKAPAEGNGKKPPAKGLLQPASLYHAVPGIGTVLPPTPAYVDIGVADTLAAIEAWDTTMPDYKGLLEAAVE